MRQVKLKPIRERTEYWDQIRSKILELLKKELYRPLLKEIGAGNREEEKKIFKNSFDNLAEAIKQGRITYHRGKFSGKLNAAISKEMRKLGAKWDSKQGSFALPRSKLPPDIVGAISISQSRFEQTASKVFAKLEKILPEEIAEKLSIEKIFDSTLWKVDNEFTNSVKAITVTPKLTDEQRSKLSKEYTKNFKLSVEGFVKEEVLSLRQKMQKSTFQGYRYESMVKTIQRSFSVSEKKAQFLARQETNLLLSGFKKSRYQDAGVNEYIWKCSAGSSNHPVRAFHKKNDGKQFRWDDPPIVNEKGDRKNPGEDFNCRCFAIPVVKF